VECLERRSLAWLIEHAHCRRSHRWLDVATGAGFIAPFVAEVTGLDVSVAMLREARERVRAVGLANVVFATGAAESLPFSPEGFHGVVCRLAAHHFLSVPKFVAEAYGVLRPGGRLLVADCAEPDNAPEVDAWHNHVEVLRDGSHVRNYTPAEWRGFVTGAGFVPGDLDQVRESVPITMQAWLKKGGCSGAAAAEVRRRSVGGGGADIFHYANAGRRHKLPVGPGRIVGAQAGLTARFCGAGSACRAACPLGFRQSDRKHRPRGSCTFGM
jgi:SAM-dependent methyltransferase